MTTGGPWPYTTVHACAGCPRSVRALGMSYCALGKWAGANNEHRCELHPNNNPAAPSHPDPAPAS